MTELIVALDGPRPYDLARQLYDKAGITWFKIGPLGFLETKNIGWLFQAAREIRVKIFLDFKMADTWDTCREITQRFGEAGIAAISTFTDRATEAALQIAEGTPLRVWRVMWLSDQCRPVATEYIMSHGIICPVSAIGRYTAVDTICPGIRRPRDDCGGHACIATPRAAVLAGAAYAVVGRPIWAAVDPLKEARAFMSALAYPPDTDG